MNTYKKFAPNVFVAKCEEEHKRGDEIIVTTRYGKENECIVFNLLGEKDGFFYYSIVRSDGFNAQEFAKRKAERLMSASANADKKSTEYWKASNKDSDFLSLGEPIKVGHHSERRHRKVIEQAHNNMSKSVEFSDKSEDYEARADYWKKRESIINLSMPESLEFYEFEIESAQAEHTGLKDGSIERRHSYSLTYAKKRLNDAKKKLDLAKRLWKI